MSKHQTRIFFCYLLLLLVSPAKSEEGKSSSLNNAFIKKERPVLKYNPVVPSFWEKFEKLRASKSFSNILVYSQKQMDSYGESSPEGYEAMLARALVFYDKGFTYAAFDSFLRIAEEQIGTDLGEYSLFWLSELAMNFPYDKDALEEFFDTHEIIGVHPDVQNFSSYFKSIQLLKYGFKKWANKHLLLIEDNSYWGRYRSYWSGVAMVANDKLENAQARFEQLLQDKDLEPKLGDRVKLQLARIYFEQGQFKNAFSLYKDLKSFELREKGRVLLEKAWTKFYMGDYARSQGILHSLKSPLFVSSLTYERYILEMLIYRQLCHYKALKNTANEFRKKFIKTIKRIRARANLKKDPILFNMAVLDLKFQDPANLIAKIREEKKLLKKTNWSRYSFYKLLYRKYLSKDRQLQMEIDQKLEPQLRSVANQLLRALDQVQFLDYTATLSSLKVSKAGPVEKYQHEKISNYKFDKVYWPVGKEYWFDELEDYKMLISSECAGETDEYQKNLEETFK